MRTYEELYIAKPDATDEEIDALNGQLETVIKAGGGKAVKCLNGGATFVWPLLQDHAYLSLEPT